MTLDEHLGTKPPTHWQPSKGRVPESKCWFNNEVVRIFGPEMSCTDPTKGYCEGKCKWAYHCEYCSKPQIWSNDLCAGEVLLCINSECSKDK